MVLALINLISKVNIIILIYTFQLHFKAYYINFKAWKINGFTFKIFEIVLAIN